jgi:hypothetical protein
MKDDIINAPCFSGMIAQLGGAWRGGVAVVLLVAGLRAGRAVERYR